MASQEGLKWHVAYLIPCQTKSVAYRRNQKAKNSLKGTKRAENTLYIYRKTRIDENESFHTISKFFFGSQKTYQEHPFPSPLYSRQKPSSRLMKQKRMVNVTKKTSAFRTKSFKKS